MSRSPSEIATDMRERLIEIDHHWCELLGLQHEMLMAGIHMDTGREREEIILFLELHIRFTRGARGASHLADRALSLVDKLKKNIKPGEHKTCRHG